MKPGEMMALVPSMVVVVKGEEGERLGPTCVMVPEEMRMSQGERVPMVGSRETTVAFLMWYEIDIVVVVLKVELVMRLPD